MNAQNFRQSAVNQIQFSKGGKLYALTSQKEIGINDFSMIRRAVWESGSLKEAARLCGFYDVKMTKLEASQ